MKATICSPTEISFQLRMWSPAGSGENASVTNVPYTSFGTYSNLIGTTSVPPTFIPVATSMASAITCDFGHTFDVVWRYPFTDCRVVWIYDLKKNYIFREIKSLE